LKTQYNYITIDTKTLLEGGLKEITWSDYQRFHSLLH